MTTRVLRYVNECEYLSYKKASLCIQFKPEWRHIVYQNICTCLEIHVSRYSYRGCDFPPIFPKVESLSLVLLHIKGTQYEQIRIYAVKIIAKSHHKLLSLASSETLRDEVWIPYPQPRSLSLSIWLPHDFFENFNLNASL